MAGGEAEERRGRTARARSLSTGCYAPAPCPRADLRTTTPRRTDCRGRRRWWSVCRSGPTAGRVELERRAASWCRESRLSSLQMRRPGDGETWRGDWGGMRGASLQMRRPGDGGAWRGEG